MGRRMFARGVFMAAWCLLPPLVLSGQSRPLAGPPAQQKPPAVAVTADVSVVQVDAVAVDARGRFVTDLRRDEVEILEDGKAQVLAGFELVSLDEAGEAPAPAPLDTRSNARPFDGRLYIVVLDDLHITAARTTSARSIARGFIERNLVPGDLAVVVSTSGNQAGGQGFTSDRARLIRAVNSCVGSKIVSPSLATLSRMGTPEEVSPSAAGPQRVWNARAALEKLAHLARYAGTVRQRRKALVLIGEGIDYDLSLRDSEASELRDRFFDFVGAANRANLTVYSFDPRVYTQMGDDMVDIASTPPGDLEAGEEKIKSVQIQNDVEFAQDNLRTLATETGGFANVVSRELNPAFTRIRDEHSHYYMIGYYPSNEVQDGTFRSIEMRVSRPGVTVRARKGYVAPKPGAGSAASPAVTAGTPEEKVPGVSPAVERALASPLPVAGFTLRATAAPFRGAGDKASVAVFVQTSGRDMLFLPKGDKVEDTVELAVVAIDTKGRSAGGTRVSASMPLSPRVQAAVARTGVVFQLRVDLKPGTYQLRIAGLDGGSGVAGSVHYDLDVPDFSKAPMSLSGVVLSADEAGQVASPQPDALLAKWLPGTPVTQREFSRDDTLTAVAELYVRAADSSRAVTVSSTVVDSGGRVYFQAAAPYTVQGGKSALDQMHTAKVPLSGMLPGTYTLRFDATTDGTPALTARREVVFAVR